MGHSMGDWNGDDNIDWWMTAIHHNSSVRCDVIGCGFSDVGNLFHKNAGNRTMEDYTDKVSFYRKNKCSEEEKRSGYNSKIILRERKLRTAKRKPPLLTFVPAPPSQFKNGDVTLLLNIIFNSLLDTFYFFNLNKKMSSDSVLWSNP